MSKKEEVIEYFKLLNNASRNLLDEFRDGVLDLPSVEGPIRGYLHAECLKLMRERDFPKPYQIWEQESLLGEGKTNYPDITLGSLGKKKENRVLAVEIKYVGAVNKQTRQGVEQDIGKLGIYLECTMCSCFVMIDTSLRFKEILDLESLGIKKHCWDWRPVARKTANPFDALIAWKCEYVKYET